MSSISSIEWTDATWNPVTGCNQISSGCKNCYAKTLSHRLKAMGVENYSNGFELSLQPHMLERPARWKKPKRVFVNSMSDLFHEKVPDAYIQKVFKVMNENPKHTFQVLTKRSERLKKISSQLNWSENIWMGVSVESSSFLQRADDLKQSGAAVKFLSVEPLLSSLGDIKLEDIDWVIVGGESGPGARPLDPDWVREIRDQCISTNTAFFFKQWGGVKKRKAGRLLDGRTWDQFPNSHS